MSYSPDAGPLVTGSAVINGQLYFGAVSAQLPSTLSPLGRWVVSSTPAPMAASEQGRLMGGGFVPAAQYAGGTPVPKLYVFYLLDQGTLTRVASSAGGSEQRSVVSSRVKQFCGTWNVPNLPQSAPQGDIGFSCLDSENNDVVFGYGYAFGYPYERRISALGFVTATSWQDADGIIHVYGEDLDGTLRVLHQDSWLIAAFSPDRPEVVPVWTQATPAHPITGGIGGYDLLNPADRTFAFDYDSSGKADCLVLYRPYSPDYAVWVVRKNTDPVTDPDNPPPPFKSVFVFNSTTPKDLFPYPLGNGDLMFAYDYEGTGRLGAWSSTAQAPGGGSAS